MSFDDTPPQEVIDAAELVGRWFAERNVMDWKLGPCMARFHEPEPVELPPEEPEVDRKFMPHCPKCWTNGHQHRNDCRYKFSGMLYHVRTVDNRTDADRAFDNPHHGHGMEDDAA